MENQNNERIDAVAVAGGGMSFQFQQAILNNLVTNPEKIIVIDPAHEMEKPIMPSELPKGEFDFRAIIAYAKEKGVTVPELTEDEKKKFMHYA